MCAARQVRRVRFLAFCLVAGLTTACGVEVVEFLNAAFEEKPRSAASFACIVPATLETVVADARFPVNLAFLPDGTLIYTEKNTGKVRAVVGGVLQDEPMVDLPTAGLAQGGCLGLALHPDFADNGWLYVGHSANDLPFDNSLPRTEYRIVRVDTKNGGEQQLIVTLPASTLPGHEGGNIHFGPDGRLYVSVGDRLNNTFPNSEAQDPSKLAGKMLRYNEDGTVPADNPFGPTIPSFAIGLRNSFDFTFDSPTGLLWAADNGFGGPTEELNLIEAGLNYGWPVVGGCADDEIELAFSAITPTYRDPLHLVDVAPTGMAFNPGDAYGPQFAGDLFIAEWVPGTIRRITLTADRRAVATAEVFATGIPDGMNDLEFGPDGLIYVTTGRNIFRIEPQ